MKSDLVCQDLGFAGALSTEFVAPNVNDTEFYKLSTGNGSTLLMQLEKTAKCDQIVSMLCQEFGMFQK